MVILKMDPIALNVFKCFLFLIYKKTIVGIIKIQEFIRKESLKKL